MSIRCIRDGATAIEDAEEFPGEYSLSQNYPNPFNPSTIINYSIPKASFVTIRVYDVLGKDVATVVDEYKPIGKYSVKFDASKLTSGNYFYRIQTSNYSETKKLILMK